MKKLPKEFKQYFWDVDFEKVNPEKSAQYIIFRLLNKGNDKAIRWLFKTYPKDLIKEVVRERRGFSAKTANFWADLLDIEVYNRPILDMFEDNKRRLPGRRHSLCSAAWPSCIVGS